MFESQVVKCLCGQKIFMHKDGQKSVCSNLKIIKENYFPSNVDSEWDEHMLCRPGGLGWMCTYV